MMSSAEPLHRVFSRRVREERIRKGMTPGALAAGAGISRIYVLQIEQGDRVNLTFKTAESLANALSVPVADLLQASKAGRRRRTPSSKASEAGEAESESEEADTGSAAGTGPPHEWVEAWRHLDERDRADLLALLRYKLARAIPNPSAVWAEVDPDGWVRPIKAGRGHREQSRSDLTATTKAPRDSAEPKS